MLSFLCRHDFYWSERHRADRCRKCGATRSGSENQAPADGGLAALLAVEDSQLEDRFFQSAPQVDDTLLEDWDRVDAAQATTTPAPAPATPAPRAINGKAGGSLVDRIEHLAAGGDLSRAETIETLLALIEDGQSSDPVVFGPSAAVWYARLHQAR